MARRIVGAAVAVVAAVLVLAGVQGQAPQDGGTWVSATPMASPREGPSSALLGDGRVLVLGGRNHDGALPFAEVYTSGAWSAADSPVLRWGHTATTLRDGRVLIAGGEGPEGLTASIDLFDPDDNTLTPAGGLPSPRKGHAATLLADGRVLFAGGYDGYRVLSDVDIYDPQDSLIYVGPFSLSVARAGLTATTLLDGRVLLAGGNDGVYDVALAEIADLSTGLVSARAMTMPRRDHSAVLLPNNNSVLLAVGERRQRRGRR